MKTIAKTLNKARFAILAVLTIGILGFLLTTPPSHADEQANSSDYNNRINPGPDGCGVSLSLPSHICVNDDDDQEIESEYYEEWDWKHNPSPGDDDLVAVTITGAAGKGGGTMTLSIQEGGDKIGGKFWKDGEKMEEQTELSWNVEPNSSRTETVYIEGQKHSDKKEDVVLKAVMVCAPASDGSTTGGYDEVIEKTTVYQIDVDVDTDNQNGFMAEGFNDDEDKKELSEKDDRHGKVLLSNVDLKDGDMFAAAFDGFDLLSDYSSDDELSDVKFVPVRIEIKEPFDPDTVFVEFKFEGSIPKLISEEGDIESLSADQPDLPPFKLSKEGMRLWIKDASEKRKKDFVDDDPSGDNIPVDRKFEWKKLFKDEPVGRVKILYLEYCANSPSELYGRKPIDVTVTDPDTEAECQDKVFVTLVPASVELVQRDVEDGELRISSSPVYITEPIPDVDLTFDNITVTGANTFQVTLDISVKDQLSEIEEGNSPINTLYIYHNGELLDTIAGLGNASQDPSIHVWKPNPWELKVSRVLTVTSGRAQAHTFRVVTNPNKAQNAGYAIGTVSLTHPQPESLDSAVSADLDIPLVLPTVFDADVVDSITATLPGLSGAIVLSESGPDTLSFSGPYTVDSVQHELVIAFSRLEKDESDVLTKLTGQVVIDESPKGFLSWAPTGSGSNFSPASQIVLDDSRKTHNLLGGVDVKHGVKAAVAPFVARILVPSGYTEKFFKGDEKVFDFFYEEDLVSIDIDNEIDAPQAPSGFEYAYVIRNAKARLFCATKTEIGSLINPLSIENGSFKTRVKYTSTQEDIAEQAGEVQNLPSDDAGNARNNQIKYKDFFYVADRLTKDEVDPYYYLLTRVYGTKLRKCLENAGLKISVTNIWDIDPSEWEAENWTPYDKLKGNVPELWVDDELSSPIVAAKYMLIGCNWLGTSSIVRSDLSGCAGEILNDAIAGDGDFAEAYKKWRGGQLAGMATVLGTVTSAYETGVRILIEPLDWVLTVPETIEGLQGEKPKAAAFNAMMAVVPIISARMLPGDAVKFMKIKFADGTIMRVNKAVADDLAKAIKLDNRTKVMDLLGPHIRSGDITRDMVKALYNDIGLLKIKKNKNYTLLKNNMRDNPNVIPRPKDGPKDRGHHDLPIAEEFHLKFLQAGLDPNAAAYGRWVHNDIHKLWSTGKGYGLGGPFNQMWRQFFAEFPNATAAQIVSRLAEIRDGKVFNIIRNKGDGTTEIVKWSFKVTKKDD